MFKNQLDTEEADRPPRSEQAPGGGVAASPEKSVRFDEASLAASGKRGAGASRVGAELEEMAAEVRRLYDAGEAEARDKALMAYCAVANEAAQTMATAGPSEQKRAMEVLARCIEVVTENSNRLNPFPELFYETYNNMARCQNLQGSIRDSLRYLLLALEHVGQLAAEQEPGSVTIVPELSLNICNAQIYLKDYPGALEFADRAVLSSKACVASLAKKLSASAESKSELERL